MSNKKNDVLALDANISKRHKDGNGYLHVSLTPITKATVNPYVGREIPSYEAFGLSDETIYYGLRDPEELKKAASTFNGLPILLKHSVDSAQAPQKELRVGSTGTNARFEAPYLMQSLSITDADAIARIESGEQREISAGYRYDPDMTPGVFEGVQYDFVMRNIRGNHIALVGDGRAGADVVVADEMPEVLKNMKGSDEMKRKTRKKNQTFKQRVTLAMDEALEEVTKDEDAPEQAADEGESFDEIVDKLLPGANEESKALLKAFLLKLQSGTEAGPTAMDEEKKEVAQDENPADDGVAKDEDTEDPEKIAKDEDAPEEEKKDAPGVAMDENTIRKIEAAATKRAVDKMRGLTTAARKCSPLIGSNLDALAFDSAEDIYAKALQLNGVNPASYPKTAYRGMVEVMLRSTPAAKVQMAMDAMPQGNAGKEIDEAFKYLGRIDAQ